GGGSTPPGCVASVNVPGLGAVSVPVGATWFYDISDEANPELLGWYSPGAGSNTYVRGQPRMPTPSDPDGGNLHSASCTTHHGRIVPDREGRDLLAMSYYGNGVILLDFTGIQAGTLPKVVGQFAQDSNTWETAYYGGYLFTGDLARGMDIIGFK
ncbi:MAG TPA: hypothetical protein VHI93_06935, partial [Candidatus Thermoplasmatota archaeon]|nr:hypothetical protein [Candidatus Thermoplasmatota archaeon]